jgi:hypothetical protein
MDLAADAAGQADLEGLVLVKRTIRLTRVTAGFFNRASASVLAGRTFTGCAKAGTLPMTKRPVPATRKFLNVVTSSPQIVHATELLAEMCRRRTELARRQGIGTLSHRPE